MKGISHLSRVTGTEHDQICRFLVGLIVGIKIPGIRTIAPLVRATRAMLDFLFLARYPVHTNETLCYLEDALDRYHANRHIFIDLGIRVDFNFPKDHFLNHYRQLIEVFGTADNFNTEYSERLHIDFAKDAYRSTNMKDEYPQMTAWLDRREKVLLHDKYISRQLSRLQDPHLPVLPPPPACQPPLVYPRQQKMAAQPSAFGVSFDRLQSHYGADLNGFKAALSRFIIHFSNPVLTKGEVEHAAEPLSRRIPFHKVSVFHRVKYVTQDPYSITPSADIVVDSIHCEPPFTDKRGKLVPGRFDTAVVNHRNGGDYGVKGV